MDQRSAPGAQLTGLGLSYAQLLGKEATRRERSALDCRGHRQGPRGEREAGGDSSIPEAPARCCPQGAGGRAEPRPKPRSAWAHTVRGILSQL